MVAKARGLLNKEPPLSPLTMWSSEILSGLRSKRIAGVRMSCSRSVFYILCPLFQVGSPATKPTQNPTRGLCIYLRKSCSRSVFYILCPLSKLGHRRKNPQYTVDENTSLQQRRSSRMVIHPLDSVICLNKTTRFLLKSHSDIVMPHKIAVCIPRHKSQEQVKKRIVHKSTRLKKTTRFPLKSHSGIVMRHKIAVLGHKGISTKNKRRSAVSLM